MSETPAQPDLPQDHLEFYVAQAAKLVDTASWFLEREPCRGEGILLAAAASVRLDELFSAVRTRARRGPQINCDCGAVLSAIAFKEADERWEFFCLRCRLLLVATPTGKIVERVPLPPDTAIEDIQRRWDG